MPDSILPRARSTLGLGGWIVCHARPGGMLGFVAISRKVGPGRLTKYAWNRLVQWARYLVGTKGLLLTMRRCPAGTDAAFFSDSSSLNGPVPGSSYGGACMQYVSGDPASAGTVMSGAIWARCLVPSKLGDSSASAELIMASVTVKEAVAHRIQPVELKQGPWGPTPLYLDALAVLHGTAADQVSREMKYLAAKLAIVQEARSWGKTKTVKIHRSCHPAGILTKPLQGKEFEFKRARLLGLSTEPPAGARPGTNPPARPGASEGGVALPAEQPAGPTSGGWGQAVGRLLGLGSG